MSENNGDLFPELKQAVFQMMENNLMKGVYYHDVAHTRLVLHAVEWLSQYEKLTSADNRLIKIAALFHDIGFIEQYDDHEESSCRIAEKILVNQPYSKHEIQHILRLIRATKLPHEPLDLMEMIMCDADLCYLGGEDYFSISSQLRKELIYYNKLGSDPGAWDKFQLQFLESHSYFTDTAKQILEPIKKKHMSILRQRIGLEG
ncbi:HD domain-containing protein [Membranicola marinus]|uniref:HD domain-containing protein n=1 Tax=Membranihabitans marinus TaxID=1227546 RepID=A0A953HSN2_9BACT|nr:HD domain-containing protein [Membranihabitans marinus]MBY5957183.1 HD domain-containing protein [Membranihabitans marinus]